MSFFEAKVHGMDCVIDLYDDNKIKRITAKESGWLVCLSKEEINKIESQYDFIIKQLVGEKNDN